MKTLTHHASRITHHVSRTTQHVLIIALLLLIGLVAAPVYASVTLVSFTATPGNGQVLLRWETATEINNAGFFVRRSFQEAGDYARISPFMPAQGDGLLGAVYVYADTTVTNGVTYYYKLEAVDNNQNVEFHGPISTTPGPTPTFTAIRVATATATTAPTSTPTLTRTSTTMPMPTATFPIPSPTFPLLPALTPTSPPPPTTASTSTPTPPPATVPSTPARTPTMTGTATPILAPTFIATKVPTSAPTIAHTATPTSVATHTLEAMRPPRPTVPARSAPAGSASKPVDWVRWLVFGFLSLVTLLVAGVLIILIRQGRR